MKYSLINYLKPTVGIRLDGCIMQSNEITRVVLNGIISNSQLAKMLSSVSNDVNVNIYTEQQLRTEQAMDQYISSRIENNIESNIENLPIEPPYIWEFNEFLNQMSQNLSIDLFQILAWTNFHNVTSILEIRTMLQNNNPILVDLPKKVLTYLRNRILGE